MKSSYFIHAIAAVMMSMMAMSLHAENRKAEFTYDVDFEMKFDNREYYKSAFSESMTIFGARLTPSVGLLLPQPEVGMDHRLMVGIDVMKDFGALMGQNNVALFREMTFYYNLKKQSERAGLEVYAGIFPRRAAEGAYSDMFFSDSLKFYDNNFEGLLVKVRRPNAYWEVGCDWMGQFGKETKERFMVFSSGCRHVNSFFDVGYSAYMYHFAGSEKARGVVDNILLNPFVRFDLAETLGFQEFSLRVGWLQSLQHDRVFVGHYVFPGGGEVDLGLKKWNVGLHGKMFYGTDMMPYYNCLDAGGDKYGTRLYFGDPFYRVHDDGTTGPGLYNRLDFFYEPYVGKNLTVMVSARFHFHGASYSGCQQVVGVRFNLNK